MSSIFEQTGRMSFGEQFSKLIGKDEKSQKQSVALPKPFPADAPARMHKSYYNNNIDKIEDIYEEQGMELPDYFDNENAYADYRRSQKMYGGKIQPRGAMRSPETR